MFTCNFKTQKYFNVPNLTIYGMIFFLHVSVKYILILICLKH